MKQKLLFTFFFSSIAYFHAFSQSNICPGGIAKFTSIINGSTYTWQVDSGYGFVDIDASPYFSGNNTIELDVINPPSNWYNYRFRCVVDDDLSSISFLTFSSKWKGGSVNRFSVAENWECGVLPDKNTDVFIDRDTVVLDTDITIRSLTVTEPGYIKMLPGVELVLTGRDSLLDDFNLTESDIEHLDTCGIDIDLLDALPPAIQLLDANSTLKNALINDILNSAVDLMNLKKNKTFGPYDTISYPDGSKTGKLAYKGLAYKFDNERGRDFSYSTLDAPRAGDKLHNNYPVYGFDCTGFVMALINNAGYTEMDKQPYKSNTYTGNFIENTTQYLNKNNSNFRTIKLVNKGFLPANQVQPGDIVLWRAKGHVGIIGSYPPTIFLYNSNGNPSPLTKTIMVDKKLKKVARPIDEAFKEQEKNWGPDRGAHPIDFYKAIKENKEGKPTYWGMGYTILRFEDFEVETGLATQEDGKINCAGEIISNGGSEIKERGVCWSKKSLPTPELPTKCVYNEMPPGLGTFSCQVTGLEVGTEYFIRAYAVNDTDTSYGEEIKYNPLPFPCNVYFLGMNTSTHRGLWDNCFTSGDFTLATWFQLREASNGIPKYFFHRQVINGSIIDELGFLIDESGKLKFQTRILKDNQTTLENLTTSFIPELFKWYHIAITFTQQGNCMIYVNGALLGSKDFGGPRLIDYTIPNILAIGSTYNVAGSSYYFNSYRGWLDETAFASKVLNLKQIQELAKGQIKGSKFLLDNSVSHYQKNDTYPNSTNSGNSTDNATIVGQLYNCQ